MNAAIYRPLRQLLRLVQRFWAAGIKLSWNHNCLNWSGNLQLYRSHQLGFRGY